MRLRFCQCNKRYKCYIFCFRSQFRVVLRIVWFLIWPLLECHEALCWFLPRGIHPITDSPGLATVVSRDDNRYDVQRLILENKQLKDIVSSLEAMNDENRSLLRQAKQEKQDALNRLVYFFGVRLLPVLRGHSGFFIPATMSSDLEGFSIPDFIHYFLFLS